ncbi:galactokinase family protein [Verrucomicrobiota bacterium sgz303538]
MTDAEQISHLKAELHRHYGIDPDMARVVCSPYRICPLGAHIDHQLGRVTAMAIDQGVYLAYAPCPGHTVRMRSMAFEGEVEVDLTAVPPKIAGDWGNYLRGAVTSLQSSYPINKGLVGVTSGTLAEGGLSSSAAVGIAYLLALEDVNGLSISPWENIERDRLIENGYLGLKNGILDQSAILLSRRSQLTVIDCKAGTHELISPAPDQPAHAWLIAFSGVRQTLVNTGYNRRVEECAEAAQTLLDAVERTADRPLLGHVTREEYLRFANRLMGAPMRRAQHFFEEMARVERGIAAWERGDLVEFGELMSDSGRSSIENYECGSPPLVDLYSILTQTDGVFGARFSGAGFRGCCIALVEASQAERAAESVRERYAKLYRELAADAPVVICNSADGARVL